MPISEMVAMHCCLVIDQGNLVQCHKQSHTTTCTLVLSSKALRTDICRFDLESSALLLMPNDSV